MKQNRIKENKARKAKGEDSLDLEGKGFEQAVIAECDRDLNQSTQELSYAEKTLAANLARERGDVDTAKDASRKEHSLEQQTHRGEP